MSNNKQPIKLYIEKSIESLPEENGRYLTWVDNMDIPFYNQWKDGKWWQDYGQKYWLCPITPSQLLELCPEFDRFLHGYIAATVAMIGITGEVNTHTREMFEAGAGNMSLETLEKKGIDVHDIEVLKKYWRELRRLH